MTLRWHKCCLFVQVHGEKKEKLLIHTEQLNMSTLDLFSVLIV